MPDMNIQKNNITFDSPVMVNPHITLQEEADHWGLLYHPEIDFSMAVNPESIFLWKLMQQKTTISEMARTIKSHFHVVPHDIEQLILNVVVGFTRIGFTTVETRLQN